VKHYILSIFIIFFSPHLQIFGQEATRFNPTVSQNGELLLNPFAGGLTSPQFSEVDLDFDGDMDLIVFDRTGDVVNPFVFENDEYRFAPSFAKTFPNPRQWMLMRDYNADGIMDIFMAPTVNGIAGVEVHTGKNINGQLEFELASITDDGFNVIYIPLGNIETQVYNSLADIPAVEDVDGDGDLDIVSFEVAGSTVTLYNNLSIERTGEPGLDYELADDCFGRIVESGFSEEITLSTDGNSCGDFFQTSRAELRHSGSTVALHDMDADGILDAVIGDISNDGLVLLNNTGTAEDAWFSEQDLEFPSNSTAVQINVFNAAFFIDINHDNEKDLIVAPNELSGLQTTNHIWHYMAQPSTAGPTFELENKNFLVDDMLYFGKESAPAFIDFNLDGLMDIVVGTGGKTDFDSKRNPALVLIKNVGTITEPAFEVFDEDYLNFSSFNTTSNSFYPTTGDLDSDGDIDLLIGDDRGFLYFVENVAGDKAVASFSVPIYQYQDLNPGQFLKPTIYDFDKDGLMDIVVGERNFNKDGDVQGSLNYFRNTGSIGDPIFSQESASYNPTFGNVFTKDQGFIRNLSAPVAIESEGRTLLLVGTESGRMRMYDDIDENLDGSFSEISTQYGDIKEGNHSYPALFDLDNDGFYEILVGNRRGGLGLYSTRIVSDIRSSIDEIVDYKQFNVFPNPTSEFLDLQAGEIKADKIELINNSGQIVFSTRTIDKINTRQLQSGTYFLKIYVDSKIEVHKVVITHQ